MGKLKQCIANFLQIYAIYLNIANMIKRSTSVHFFICLILKLINKTIKHPKIIRFEKLCKTFFDFQNTRFFFSFEYLIPSLIYKCIFHVFQIITLRIQYSQFGTKMYSSGTPTVCILLEAGHDH